MSENQNDRSQQSYNKPGQQSIQNRLDSDLNKTNIKVQEMEEWDILITDQRRPQFRSEENYRKRNF